MKDYQQRERESRDILASEYDSWFIGNRGPLFDVLEREVFSTATRRARAGDVLDAGCGTGRITTAIEGEARRIFPLDFSLMSLLELRRKTLLCPPVCGDLTKLPYRDNSFDLVTSCQVLSQLQFSETVAALDEMRRVLRPGGLLVFSAYNLEFWRSRRGVFEEGDEGAVYFKRFTRGYVKYLAERTLFELVKLDYFRALRLERTTNTSWLTLDRAISAIPGIRRRACSYLVATFMKSVT